MALNHAKNVELWHRAEKVIPLGANSNFRFAGEMTFFCDHAKGSHVWDVDGNEYIDFKNGFGPIILGHAYDEVDDKIRTALKKGVSYAAVTEDEVELAERFVRICPCVDKVRV
jgi:glutamate-1-semialdehyde 2,1-aminomutase